MKRFLLVCAAMFLLLGCGSDSDDDAADTKTAPEVNAPAEDTLAPAEDTTPGDAAGALLGFGEVCADNAECESNVCHAFGQGTWCTITCETDDECPEGSEGKKCNKQKVCRP